MSFADLKRNRANSLEKLNSQIEKFKSDSVGKDPRFWKLSTDKAGNGYAVIRFLPEPEGEDFAFVRFFRHGFKNKNNWFIEKCPTSLGKECPCCENNSELWNTNVPENQAIVRNRKRQLKFVSNVLVVEDKSNPENEGKVFLFEYGKKIHDKLVDAGNPQFPDQAPLDPFNMWSGADFKLKAQTVDSFLNYDRSGFAAPAEIPGGEKKQKEIYESLHSLQELVSEDKFESYDTLKTRLNKVLGVGAPAAQSTGRASSYNASPEAADPLDKVRPAAADDDDMAIFDQLANFDDDIPF